MSSRLAASGYDARRRMGSVIRLNCGGRTSKRSRAPVLPLLRLLPLLMALLSVARSQPTTLLRRSCAADSAAALRCSDGSCNEGSRASRVQLAGVVSALRESEIRSTQLYLNLTSATEHYRAAAVAERSSELVAGAARNACDAQALELRAIADASVRQATNTSASFRRAADERTALQRRADGTDERLRTHDEGLRTIERTLSEMLLELNATSRDVAKNERQRVSDMSTLRLGMLSRLASIEDHINNTGSMQNKSVECLSLIHDAVNNSLTSMHMAIQRDLQETIMSESKWLLVQSEMTRNVSSLSDFVGSALSSVNEMINVSTDQMVELFGVASRHESEINWLNQTQHNSEASWRSQASALNVQLISVKGDMARNWSSLAGALESLRYSMNERLTASSNRTDAVIAVVNQHTSAIGNLNRTQQQNDASWKHQVLNLSAEIRSNERQRVTDMNTLRLSTLSRLASINERVGSIGNQLNESVERSSLSHNSLNNTLTSLGVAIGRDIRQATVQAETAMRIVKNEMASNLSSLADALASLNHTKLIDTGSIRISELFTIADQLKAALSHLNRTQQESDFSWKHEALALSAELNSTKLGLERLREQFGRLREDNERLIATNARNMSAALRECPSGWQRNGSWCYILVTTWSGSWNDTRGRCNMMSADFVTVPSAEVNAFLTAYLVNLPSYIGSVWLGATDVAQEGVWRWITGDTFYSRSQLISYSNFAFGEPANSYLNRRIPENCLTMNRLGTWNDQMCNLSYPFFCRMYRP